MISGRSPISPSKAPMFLRDRKFAVPPSLLAATCLIMAVSTAASADTLTIALADRSGLVPHRGLRAVADENDRPLQIPLPGTSRIKPVAAPDHHPVAPSVNSRKPMPEIHRDLENLPTPVKLMRDRMLKAARSGDIERLRPLLGVEDKTIELSLNDHEEDVIDFLKSLAGDVEGREILAIIADLLGTGYVHMNVGKDDEVYVWPYFYAMPLDRLTPPQIVELFEIVTASDFEEMKKAGGYIFYSIGISPDGSWRFFTAGE